MDITGIKKKTTAEIEKAIMDARESLRVFRFGAAGSRTRNVKEGRTTRRSIARMLTELRTRALDNSGKNA